MTEVDGSAVKIHAPYHFEANELNVIGGKFVYTYCTNWASNDSEWNTYKAEHGISAPRPDWCTMCYMVSDTPTDPNSWVYKDVYGPHPGMGTNNNHSHLQKFQGQYYHIYHGAPLKESWKNAGVVGQDCGVYRSICVNKATVNESSATINKVTTNLTGVTQIKNLDPYEWQQAETMANCGGVDYEDITNIKKNGRINSLGNDASENMQVKMRANAWINVRGVDYGSTGAAKFTLRAKGTGTMEIRNGNSSRTTVAAINFSSTDFEDQTIDIPADKVLKGVKNNLYLVVTDATDFFVDAWKFTEVGASAIQEITSGQQLTPNTQYYDLQGRRLTDASQQSGIVIEQYTDVNGAKHCRKVIVR